ncbi:MAG: DNA mismatch repair endonuclease MutL [Kiritimatiellae bacterium]|nr:DNA mismatch repair endonuclease MutL [Kiritimatiellia bacterium]
MSAGIKRDGHVRLLPLHIANKIAAGEVVERPASVVKELVENSIDAGATRIEISVTAGGRKLIEVRDNGCGMNRDDAMLCLERQATSKIRDVEDIERIDTLGFRGEAIPSIASVSRFSLRTRRADEDAGTELVVVGGALQEVNDIGVPPGTTVSVRDLFFNVPARRKFLRAYQTEQTHIRSVFTIHALAHPDLGLTLVSDGRQQASMPPGATLAERVRDLFGPDFIENMRPVDYRSGAISVTGFAGIPTVTRNDRSEQYVFINHRPATAPVIAYALREAYPNLEGSRKPIVVLFVDLPPEDVDVNVHPTKREVRFCKPAEVREAIIRALSEALGVQRKTVMPQPAPDTQIVSAPPKSAPSVPLPTDVPESKPFVRGVAPEAWSVDAPTLRGMVPEAAGAARPEPMPSPFPYPAPQPAPLPNPVVPPVPPVRPPVTAEPIFEELDDSSPWRWCRVLGQAADRYILLETDSGYVTVDPQAARERVMYEQLMDGVSGTHGPSQRLLIPETVNLPPRDAARLRKHLELLRSMGFEVSDFGSDHFLVEALPAVLGQPPCRELLANIAADLEEAGSRRGAAKWREELIAKAACRAVSGTATKMDLDQAQQLVNDLAATRMPYTCPRGRPTMIFTSYRELERKFGR